MTFLFSCILAQLYAIDNDNLHVVRPEWLSLWIGRSVGSRPMMRASLHCNGDICRMTIHRSVDFERLEYPVENTSSGNTTVALCTV